MSLSSFFGIGGGSRPSTQQVIQTSKLPEEIAPFAKEVLEEAKALYGSQVDAGYTPYTGDTIASFTPEQQRAQRALAGLYGSSDQTFADVAKITEGLDEKFTGDIAQEYMSPYQQAVTDIEKRKAMEDYSSRIMPGFEKRAIDAGGMSGLGSRAAIEAAQLGGKQAERLGDIQAKGLQRAYADAQSQFAQQKERERMQAGDMLKTQGVRRASDLQELGALSTVGEQKQALAQQALDEAYYKHLEKQAYPQEKLAEYSGFVYGNPLMSQRDVTKTSPMGQGPGLGAQLMGAGMTAGKLYAQGGGFGDGFSWAKMFGGAAAAGGGGIASLPMVYRQENGSVNDPDIRRQDRDMERWAQGHPKIIDGRYYYPKRVDEEGLKEYLGGSNIGVLGDIQDPYYTGQGFQGIKRVEEQQDPREAALLARAAMLNKEQLKKSLDLDAMVTDRPTVTVKEALRRKEADTPSKKADPNPLRTVGGLREYMERMTTEKDKLARTQLKGRESFTTKAGQEREAAIADRASKIRGETRRRGGIFGEDFAPAAIQQLLAVTPPGSPRRGLLERVMLGASAGSQALTKAQDEREDVMRDIEEDAGTARISAKEQDLTARAANLTQKQKLDLNKLTNKFDLEKKLAELPAEEAARLRKIMLSDAELKLKDAQIKELLAKAEKALAEAGQAGLLTPKQTNDLNIGYDRIDNTLTGLGMIKGAAISPAVASYRAAAREKANKAYITTKSTNAAGAAYRRYMEILATKIEKGEIK